MRTAITLSLSVLLLTGCGGGAAASQSGDGINMPPTFTPPSSTWSPPIPTYTPSVGEFTVSLSTLKKQCFGSAGCNVTYRIRPAYSGAVLGSSQSFTVAYTVLGGEEEQQGSFTITGEELTFSGEEMIQTRTSKARLIIRVDEVLPN